MPQPNPPRRRRGPDKITNVLREQTERLKMSLWGFRSSLKQFSTEGSEKKQTYTFSVDRSDNFRSCQPLANLIFPPVVLLLTKIELLKQFVSTLFIASCKFSDFCFLTKIFLLDYLRPYVNIELPRSLFRRLILSLSFLFFSFFYETWTNKKENNNNNRNDRARDGWLIPFNEYRKQNIL